MDQTETRDLPGNDASWYRALLVDQDTATEAPSAPEQQSLPIDPDPQPEPTTVDDGLTGEDKTPDTEAADETGKAEDVAEEQPDAEGDPDESDADDLVVTPPAFTGDTKPVHFPDDITEHKETVPATEDAATNPTTDTAETAQPVMSTVPVPDRDEPLDNTSEMVGQLWTSSEPDNSFDAWEPDAMDSKINSSRKFRWSSVVVALAVVALIVVGLVLLPSMTRNRADAHRDMMVAALHELRAELPDTQSSLQAATEPASDNVSLSDLSTQLTVLTAKASAVDDAARAELPTAPPLTSSEPIDELAPIQQRLEPLATTAQTIQRRIGNLAEYRMLMRGFLALPELPSTADTATQADLRVVLASAQAESASILAELPSDVSLSEHQELARGITDMFASWQIEYLEALRTQDPLAAGGLVDQLQADLAELDAELITPLAQIRRQTDTDLIDLARSIDEVIAIAAGTQATP